MNRTQTVIAILIATGAAFGARAEEGLGQHPAVRVQKMQRGIDPNTFIVAHPARGVSTGGHAGHEHPALTAWREAAQPKIDANHFLVQPPATTAWPQPALGLEPTVVAVAPERR